ncbi:MAG TPA: sigma-70 family RNA polymerase sigma factor [Gemmatimonadota bacterium]|nr:sigma-70 family RNA polymerase sigma factor [Gemmatimonadota bacterium]
MSVTATDLPRQPGVLGPAQRGDRRAFQELTEPFRAEIQLHCYRMLGSLHDAEDLVQETFLRAWRGLADFEGRSSFKNWLYRIATNACLNSIASRKSARRRPLPQTEAPAARRAPEGGPATEIAWLEPYPDTALAGVAEPAPGPDTRYEMRESVQVAFIAAIQNLPPRQRAVLLLRDVLGWSAAESAELLDSTVAAVNSALQRARGTLAKRFPQGRRGQTSAPSAEQRALLERYVRAWEHSDLEGFVALLKEDAVLSMPPWREWYDGREAIRGFFAAAFGVAGEGAFRLVPTAANGQPAFAQYTGGPEELDCPKRVIQVLTIEDGAIAALTFFTDPEVFAAFAPPEAVPAPSA